jgi:integrase
MSTGVRQPSGRREGDSGKLWRRYIGSQGSRCLAKRADRSRQTGHLHLVRGSEIQLLAALGNDYLLARSQIPTARQGARLFYDWQQGRGHKSLKDVQSLIGGRPPRRRGGRQPPAPSFADYFASTPLHRIDSEQIIAWYVLRVPPERQASFHKKAKSMLTVFLTYCHARRWILAATLLAADQIAIHDVSSDSRWLKPAQLQIYDRLISSCRALDDYDRFVWITLRDTGLRTFELPQLRPSSLLTDERALVVPHGKGAGAGKLRLVPVDEDYLAHFAFHVQGHGITHGEPIFFARDWRLLRGKKDQMGWVADRHRPASTKSIRGVIGRIQRAVDQAKERGEISFAEVPSWKLDPKVLRKTFACQQYLLYVKTRGEAGMDLIRLQSALGHSSPAQTRIYLADVDRYLDASIPRTSTADAAARLVELG